ncbi:hypothetical protein BSKO_10681 [Bryopsis sp. KO-2023]|nr:hypothetical protein BSKO_10681 [Bryopsis sp. KO-2023]
MTSVLDDLGEEVTGIAFPVSLCMALTVALVKILNPDGESDRKTVLIAAAYYDEQEGDSTSKKFSGSIVNALIFVAAIGVITFVLFLLFKYGCVKFIYAYMGFAVLNIFFFLTGAVLIGLLKTGNIHLDALSLCFILFNFSVVGMLGLFFWPSPLLLKQGYLVVVGVIVAYIFTWTPEWTSWVLLVFMALYDLCAVLAPGGPLKALVELAIERQEEIPALVYEARPVRGGQRGWNGFHRQNEVASEAGPIAEGNEGQSRSFEDVSEAPDSAVGGGNASQPETPLVRTADADDWGEHPNVSRQSSGPSTRSRRSSRGSRRRGDDYVAPEDRQDAASNASDEYGLPDSIKLGLGDFIFYSVLVGRAAFYDFMTVFAAYIAIVAGLGLTLLLLAVWKRALPALPISIALGGIFYFLTRLLFEPFVVPLTLRLAFF